MPSEVKVRIRFSKVGSHFIWITFDVEDSRFGFEGWLRGCWTGSACGSCWRNGGSQYVSGFCSGALFHRNVAMTKIVVYSRSSTPWHRINRVEIRLKNDWGWFLWWPSSSILGSALKDPSSWYWVFLRRGSFASVLWAMVLLFKRQQFNWTSMKSK